MQPWGGEQIEVYLVTPVEKSEGVGVSTRVRPLPRTTQGL